MNELILEVCMAIAAFMWQDSQMAGFIFCVISTISWYPVFSHFLSSPPGEFIMRNNDVQWISAFVSFTAVVLTGSSPWKIVIRQPQYAVSGLAVCMLMWSGKLLLENSWLWYNSTYSLAVAPEFVDNLELGEYWRAVFVGAMTVLHCVHYFVIHYLGDSEPIEDAENSYNANDDSDGTNTDSHSNSARNTTDRKTQAPVERSRSKGKGAGDDDVVKRMNTIISDSEGAEGLSEYFEPEENKELPGDLVEITAEEAMALQEGRLTPQQLKHASTSLRQRSRVGR